MAAARANAVLEIVGSVRLNPPVEYPKGVELDPFAAARDAQGGNVAVVPQSSPDTYMEVTLNVTATGQELLNSKDAIGKVSLLWGRLCQMRATTPSAPMPALSAEQVLLVA
jgi:hypothetical protein